MKRETGVKQVLTWLLILLLAAPPAAMGQDAGGASQSTFTEEQLTQMMAPLRFILTSCFPRYSWLPPIPWRLCRRPAG